MDCPECDYKEFDHYVEGSPTAVYTCGHPKALEIWAETDGRERGA